MKRTAGSKRGRKLKNSVNNTLVGDKKRKIRNYSEMPKEDRNGSSVSKRGKRTVGK
jgi:hypothetical protein